MTEVLPDPLQFNSIAHWQKRFPEDWEAKGGREQTRQFMEALIKFLPAALYEELASGELSILDCGCAEGDGTAVLAQTFPSASVAGFDFSEKAVEKARGRFTSLEFFVTSFGELDRPADILISSHCFEHLTDPISSLAHLASQTRRFLIVLVPFLEAFPPHEEHVRVVHPATFPETIASFRLMHRILVPPLPLWHQYQLLLIYEPAEVEAGLAELREEIRSLREEIDRASESLGQQLQQREAGQLLELTAQVAEAGRRREAAENEAQSLALRLSQSEGRIARLQSDATRRREIRSLREEIGRMSLDLSRQLQQRETRRLSELVAEIGARARRDAELEAKAVNEERRREAVEAELRNLAQRLGESHQEVARLQADLATIHGSRLWRVAHFYWSLRRLLRREPPPLSPPVEGPPLELGQPRAPVAQPGPWHEVVCFSIIDWTFRFQRPQQLMMQLARRGHRVFYISQRFREEGEPYEIRELAKNVYEVSLRGPKRKIYSELLGERDCDRLHESLNALRRDLGLGATASVVQLPFWKPLAERAWKRFAWPIVYDCMDHHAGFSTNDQRMVRQERGLLSAAHLVLASSSHLYDGCRRVNPRVILLPNACDFEHFAQAGEPPQRARPVVGYFGAIAEWFDSDLVADLAEARPDWDFVLVGSTFTADVSRLSTLSNVQLTGEKPYTCLPEWIERFNVLILPFKRLPLTEATNPVKAYEILASGRPLVSIPLPEMTRLSPLVRLASTAKEFEREIESALAEWRPNLVEARREFARENTWKTRVETLVPHLREAFPKVSIVIVTIDNLAINRLCLESLYERTAWPNFEVIVVDNASTDGTAEFLAEAQQTYLSLQVILNDHNAGFAAATNQGLHKATGEYLVLLNNDTVVTRGWLSTLVRHLHARPELGLVGPVSNAVGNQAKVDVSYRTIQEMPEWAAHYVRDHDGELFPIPMLGMFCLALRREAFERIGSLDERFGIGMFEDDDYSRRARALGYQLLCTRDVFIHHWQKSSFRALGEAEYARILQENRRKYEEKWGETWKTGVAIRPAREDAEKIAELLERIEESRGAVVFFPSLGWSASGVRRPHQLARAFAELGYVTVYQCIGTSDWVEGVTEIEPNLFLFMAEEASLHRLSEPILWCQPFNFHLARNYSLGARTVYDWDRPLADYPFELALLEKNHRRALTEATLVTSPKRKLWGELCESRDDALHLPDGLGNTGGAETQATGPDDPKLAWLRARGRPIAGYCGDLADGLDYDMLEKVVRLRPDWSFLFVGSMSGRNLRGRVLLENPNVVWTGPREQRDLPGYLRLIDVALVPFRTDCDDVAVLFGDYFANGKPVVSTPLRSCRAIPEVRIACTAEEVSRELDAAREAARDSAFQERLRERAREVSWQARAEEILASLGSR